VLVGPTFVHITNTNSFFRSKRCVFLGYSTLHKGVKCLDVTIGRVYISRDVVFDENIFPFASLNPNVGRRLREDMLLLPPDKSSSACSDRGVHTNGHYLHLVPLVVSPQVSAKESTTSSESEPTQNSAATTSNGTSNSASGAENKTTFDRDDPEANPAKKSASDRPPSAPGAVFLACPRATPSTVDKSCTDSLSPARSPSSTAPRQALPAMLPRDRGALARQRRARSRRQLPLQILLQPMILPMMVTATCPNQIILFCCMWRLLLWDLLCQLLQCLLLRLVFKLGCKKVLNI
jgi:hypothetical protein